MTRKIKRHIAVSEQVYRELVKIKGELELATGETKSIEDAIKATLVCYQKQRACKEKNTSR